MARALPVRILRYLRKKFDILILAYSGGTDSTLLLLLCKSYNIPIDYVVYNNTGLEYGDIIAYVRLAVSKLGITNFAEVHPEVKPRDLAKMILEDFHKTYACKTYDKSDFRCCEHAKEKPMAQWIRENNLDVETTCILRGLRANESSQRFMSTLKLIASGHFYHHNFYRCKRAQVSDPFLLMTDQTKEEYLNRLCIKYGLPKPQTSGCIICPIYYRFAKGPERETPRFMIAKRFFETRARNLITSYS